MTAAISDAARNLGKLAKQADRVREQIAEKASELGLLTQELFVIEQSMQAVIADVSRSQIYDERGHK